MVFNRGDDLHRVSILKLVIEWDQTAVHLCPHALMPDVGMNTVGEIDRGSTLGELPHLPVGGKYIYLCREEVHFDCLQKLPVVLQIHLPLKQLP